MAKLYIDQFEPWCDGSTVFELALFDLDNIVSMSALMNPAKAQVSASITANAAISNMIGESDD